MTEKTTVVLVDDHPVFRKGLRMLLEDEVDFNVIGEASDGEEAIALLGELEPEVAVLDISMPGMSGIEVAERISVDCPNTKIVALSIHSEKRFVEEMLLAGAAGYILKQSAPEDLVNGIRTVIEGEAFLSPSITSVVLSGFKKAWATESVEQTESVQIISSKLSPAIIPTRHVKRKALMEGLKKGAHLPVTLISAPAGYGKSTTVSYWLQHQSTPSAWITLDETDNNLRQFLHYFIHTLQTLFPGILLVSESLVKAAKLPPIHTVAVNIIRELESITHDVILVLDDIHLVHDKSVYDFLSEILRYPPRHLHFIIMGRRDPFLPIASLRGKHMLTELRTADLRFSREETFEYLQLILGEKDSQRITDSLHRKMEGWIGGLRLAILSLGQEEEGEKGLVQLKGDSHYVQEYLFNEVLENLPSALRSDVINLAIFDRFCGPLAATVVPTTDCNGKHERSGWDFIKELRTANLFLVSLDSEKVWFRFHHLFQQLLEKQLHRSATPQKIEELHRVASVWLVNNGLISEAIKHAIYSKDVDWAEEIVRQNRHEESGSGWWSGVEQWLSLFPEEAILSRPTLLLAYAWTCHDRYHMQEVLTLVEEFESITAGVSVDGPSQGELCLLKGILCYWNRNSKECLRWITEASELLPDSYHFILGLLEMYKALALQMVGNSTEAINGLNTKILNAGFRNSLYRCRLMVSLSFVHSIAGNFNQAYHAAESGRLLSAQNNLVFTETCGHHVLGNISLQRFDLEKAVEHFSALDDKLHHMHPRAAIDAMAGLALTRFFQQHIQEAFAVSDRLDRFARQTEDQYLVAIAHSLKARLFILDRGKDGAGEYQQLMGQLDPFSVLFNWLEQPKITRIRALISLSTIDSLNLASELLEELKPQLVATHNNYQLVEVLVLEVVLMLKTDNATKALSLLEETVALTLGGGWIRPFVEAGHTVLELLHHLEPATDKARQHIQAILIFENNEAKPVTNFKDFSSAMLAEPLTSRESEILELLAQRLRNKEIGEALFISPETVKSHIKRLFSKLDAADRRDVVEKANALGLLKK